MSKNDDSLAVKVGTMVLTLAAGWVAQKAVGLIWQRTTGHVAPRNLDDDDITVVQAVTFAAVSGGIAVLARRLAHTGARRAVARYIKAPAA